MNEKTNTYEGMFLLDSGSDFEAASQPVQAILTRYGAQVLAMKPWDERRLAYEVAGRRRGLYALAYFKVDPERVREIEHDCQLDERVLRALILRREHLTQEMIDAPTPATGAPQRLPDSDERFAGRREPAEAVGIDRPEGLEEPAEEQR